MFLVNKMFKNKVSKLNQIITLGGFIHQFDWVLTEK